MRSQMPDSHRRFTFLLRVPFCGNPVECSPSTRGHATTVLAIMVVVSLLSALTPSPAAAAQPEAPSPTVEFPSQNAWRSYMAQVAVPKKGCFTAAYPNATWQEVPCKTAPPTPYPPRFPTVGLNNDYSAEVSPHFISSAVGSFPSVTGVTSEKGTVGGANAFSLQLNTNFFAGSPRCNRPTTSTTTRPPGQCLAWQQFVFGSVSHTAFMQYWLISYQTASVKCPTGWFSYSSDCYTDSKAVDVPAQKITSLGKMSLTGKAISNGLDTLTLSVDDKLYSVTNEDSMVTLAKFWDFAEFNVFGDGSSSQAQFNKGSTITVKVSVSDGVKGAPSCVNQSTTSETNNLNIVNTTSIPPKGPTPEIVFTESTSTSSSKGEACHSLPEK